MSEVNEVAMGNGYIGGSDLQTGQSLESTIALFAIYSLFRLEHAISFTNCNHRMLGHLDPI